MQRVHIDAFVARPQVFANTWLARRWYYTPKSHRAYSVRQIAPGDRRLLAEFAVTLMQAAHEREQSAAHTLAAMIFDRVIGSGADTAYGLAALESTTAGDRVIGVAAYAPSPASLQGDGAEFCVAVADTHRDEQVGKTLLSTLVRHARRVGVSRLSGEMSWSNRPMQVLALSMGFAMEPVARDRTLRRLVLGLR